MSDRWRKEGGRTITFHTLQSSVEVLSGTFRGGDLHKTGDKIYSAIHT